MGNLNKQRVYLSGAIDRVNDYGTTWRDRETPNLKRYGLVVADPLKKPLKHNLESTNHIGERHALKAAGELDRVAAIMKRIRNIDLRLVDECPFIIVYAKTTDHLFGTVEEIVTANRSKKPVLVVIEEGKNHAPDWLLGMIGPETIFNSFDELYSYLDLVDKHPNPQELSKRWLLFDWELCI